MLLFYSNLTSELSRFFILSFFFAMSYSRTRCDTGFILLYFPSVFFFIGVRPVSSTIIGIDVVMSALYEEKTFAPLKGLHIRMLNDTRLTERIKVLDDYCFPVKYTESYYSNYVRNSFHPFNQLAFFNDILVGSITCRLQKTDVNGEYMLYIMTIGVLEPYRHLQIGSRLLQTVLSAVHNDTKTRIVEVTLHVQVGSSALEFYRRFNFEEVCVVEGYYSNLDECNAILLRRVVPQPFYENHKKSK